MLPFRVVIDTEYGATTQVVTLPRAPEIGDEVKLPHGAIVRISRVLSADDDSVRGVLLVDSDD